jgi:hypothetical protein
VSTRVSYFITCDICGESAGHSHTESVARQEVRRHGWVRVRDVEGKLVDMCWRCAERAEMERDQQREDIRNLKAALAAANARAEAAEAANARCREANILLANSRNTAAEEWRTRAEAAEARAVNWTPVAEALPQTELRVLACYTDGRMSIILRALYIPARTVLCYEDFEDSKYDEETGAIYYPGGWYEAIEEGEYTFAGPLSGTVTHWAHMPKLPEVQP